MKIGTLKIIDNQERKKKGLQTAVAVGALLAV
jgi:hypothetical protein